MSASAVSSERVLKELSELWVTLAKSDESGVLRACAMTLIVATDEGEDAAVMGEMLAELMHDHPSRAIVLRSSEGSVERLESRVFAQCWMPFGRRQQICCEQIELTASDASLAQVPKVISGLVAPDLPVVLAVRSARLLTLPQFSGLAALASKVIVDSRRAGRILAREAPGAIVADLAWTAITPWREAIASAFDDRAILRRLAGIRSIEVGSGGGVAEPLYLAAWLARGIGGGALVRIAAGDSAEPIESVELKGEGISLDFSRGTGPVLHVATDGVAHSMPFAVLTDWDLLREELAIPGRDLVFEDTLDRALVLGAGPDARG